MGRGLTPAPERGRWDDYVANAGVGPAGACFAETPPQEFGGQPEGVWSCVAAALPTRPWRSHEERRATVARLLTGCRQRVRHAGKRNRKGEPW